jgi:hypothetical protein
MIPKTIHYCWISGEPYPSKIENCIKSWKKNLPDYELVLWDKKRIADLEDVWLQQSVDKKKYAFAADFIRIYALYKFGGIYLDADVEVVSSLDPFLKHKMFIGLDYNNFFEPAIFGAVVGHPFLQSLLGYYENRQFIRADGKFDIRPLPAIFGEIAYQKYHIKETNKFQYLANDEVAIYPYDYFSPKSEHFDRIKTTGNTVAIHHFEGSWVNKNTRYKIKKATHQFLLLVGGRNFHNQVVKLFREIFDQHNK